MDQIETHVCCARVLEDKVDTLIAEVAVLKEQMKWRNKLLIALGGLLGALLTLLSGGCVYAPPVEPPPMTTDLLETAVTVQASCVFPNHPMAISSASGVAVGPNLVVTARHVIACELPDGNDGEPISIFVTPLDGVPVEFVVEVEGETFVDDFALLKAANGAMPFAVWEKPHDRGPLANGHSIVCRAPAFPQPEILCGYVLYYRIGDEFPGWGYFLYATAGQRGNSGSGIFDEYGRLVGIHVAANDAGSYGYSAYRWYERVPEYIPPPDEF